jgi:hypothetical protein
MCSDVLRHVPALSVVCDCSAAGVAFFKYHSSNCIMLHNLHLSTCRLSKPQHTKFLPAEEVLAVEVFIYEFINSNRFCKYFGSEQ